MNVGDKVTTMSFRQVLTRLVDHWDSDASSELCSSAHGSSDDRCPADDGLSSRCASWHDSIAYDIEEKPQGVGVFQLGRP